MAKNEVLMIAKKYADTVRSVMNTDAIYLYRSQANGTANKYSDIDIAVIVDEIAGNYLQTVANLWKLTRSISDEIEPVLLTSDDNTSGFLQTVKATGIAV